MRGKIFIKKEDGWRRIRLQVVEMDALFNKCICMNHEQLASQLPFHFRTFSFFDSYIFMVTFSVSAQKERGVRKARNVKKATAHASWLRFEGPAKFPSLDFLVSIFDAKPSLALELELVVGLYSIISGAYIYLCALFQLISIKVLLCFFI